MSETDREGTASKIGDHHELRFERFIDRAVEKVWAALTVPERIAGWLADAEVEPRVGGRYELRFRHQPYTMSGAIRAFEPPVLLEYTWPEPGHRTPSIVRFLLEHRGQSCRLRLTQTWPDKSSPASDRFDHLFIQPMHYAKTLWFFTEVLGWPRLDDDNAKSRLASFQIPGGASLVLSEDHPEAGDSAKTRGHNGARTTVHFRVGDIDALYATLPKGAHIAVEPVNTHWGTRWFVLEDPDGNLFAFESQPRAGVRTHDATKEELANILSGWHAHLDALPGAVDGVHAAWDAAHASVLMQRYALRLS